MLRPMLRLMLVPVLWVAYREFPPIFTNREIRSALKRGIGMAPSTINHSPINQFHRTRLACGRVMLRPMLRFLTADRASRLT